MVSFLSAITLLGTPSEVYLYGSMYCYQGEVIVCFSLNLSSIDREDTYPFEVILDYADSLLIKN